MDPTPEHDNDAPDGMQYMAGAYEEAADHLDLLAYDLERGLEKNCIQKVADQIRAAGKKLKL